MLENWVWDHDIVKRISKHYLTGESLSDEMIDKIAKINKDSNGSDNLSALMDSIFDLLLHSYPD